MSRKPVKQLVRPFVLMFFFCQLIAGCVGQPVLSGEVVVTGITLPEENSTITPSPSILPSVSPSPSHENGILPVVSPTSTPAEKTLQTGIWTGPGEVTVPILLFHHVSDQKQIARYAVPIMKFRQQMELLDELGYQTISISDLVGAVKNGAYLPEKPIILTFDDGAEDVYTTAYPIMKTYGFNGTIFIVGNYIDAEGFLSVAQIQDLSQVGWEVGSHSMSHANLYQAPSLSEEILKSRKFISERTGNVINIFAYPFGVYNEFLSKKVVSYGYQAAVGLGWSSQHNLQTLYYLSRMEVKNTLPLYQFNSKLPWRLSSDRFAELFPD